MRFVSSPLGVNSNEILLSMSLDYKIPVHFVKSILNMNYEAMPWVVKLKSVC